MRGELIRKASAAGTGRAHADWVAADEIKHTELPDRLADAVVCAECGGSSGLDWRGWLAYRVDDPHSGLPAELGFYCPACAGGPSRRAAR